MIESDYRQSETTRPVNALLRSWTQKSLLASLSADAPVLTGVKLDGEPMTFQTTYKRNLTGDTRVFSGLVVPGGGRKRISRVKDQKNDRVISTPAPAIPFHVSQVAICRSWLCENFFLVVARPHQPSGCSADREVVFEVDEEENWRKHPNDCQR